MSLTETGAKRQRYAETIEPAPSRFANEGADYTAWAARADAWTEQPAPMSFWQEIDAQLDRIAAEKPDTFDGVKAILSPIVDNGAVYGNDTTNAPDAAFFGGSGGDRSLKSALHPAGWVVTWMEASYYYMMIHRVTGEKLTYIEGDVLRGDAR